MRSCLSRRRSACPPVRPSPGFTLVEVLVALAVAGMLVLLAHALFSAGLDGGHRLQSARHGLDREQSRHRFLGSAFLSLEIGTDEAAFDGRPRHLSFAAWLPTADGWFERNAITLAVEEDRLVARTAGNRPLILLEGLVSARFDYLLELGADSRWVEEWVSPVSAPLALRLRLTRRVGPARVESDTTVYLIKARG